MIWQSIQTIVNNTIKTYLIKYMKVNGPIFIQMITCKTNIIWETPSRENSQPKDSYII